MSSVDRGHWHRKLHGRLYPAVVVPMDEKGRIVSTALNRYIGYMNAQPADGVALWVHTSRGLKMDREMRVALLKAWRAGLERDRIIIAGAGGLFAADEDASTGDRAYIEHAVSMARDAAEFGADALLVWAPVRFRGRPDQDERIVETHRAIAAVGLPMIVFYLYESAGGVTYSLDVLRKLFAIPEVVGIKMATLDSVMTYQDVSTLIQREFADVTLITGEDRFLGYSIMRGATAALIGMGAA
ncbi:MAG: dihydrodipicolinate synthase family protein, partial [Phycisphaerae bacterium]